MTKQELIEKEKKEIAPIKKVLEEQGMDQEEIEKHIGKNYQVDIVDIEVRMPQEMLEINEEDYPLSLRTEKKKNIGSLEVGELEINNLQHSMNSAKTDDVLHTKSKV